jgi:two-component system response regulator HydG
MHLKEVFSDPADVPGADSQAPSELIPDEGIVVYRSGMTLEELEQEAIRAVLDEFGGNRRKAAERLGIGERTLYRKIKRYGLDD